MMTFANSTSIKTSGNDKYRRNYTVPTLFMTHSQQPTCLNTAQLSSPTYMDAAIPKPTSSTNNASTINNTESSHKDGYITSSNKTVTENDKTMLKGVLCMCSCVHKCLFAYVLSAYVCA